MIDIFLLYQFIRRLSTPFEEWEAYELGIIDKDGNILRKSKTLRLKKEREAFGKFDVMILKIKKLLAKIPGGESRIASYAAALWLIKEHEELNGDMLTEDVIQENISNYTVKVNELKEEIAIANSAGSGNIAGIGVGPDGEPGVKRKKKYKMLKRKKDGY